MTSTPTQARGNEKLRRECGEVFLKALEDSRTIEILLNADGKLWQERLGERLAVIGSMTASQGEAIIRTVAGSLGMTVTLQYPVVEGEFPLDGSRFAGQLPPIVGAPTFAIRKKASAIFTLAQYVETGIMNESHREVIVQAVAAHRNILVVGGTGSGKTTLTNAIIDEIVRQNCHERLVIIEDTEEIQCAAPNCVTYHTTIEIPMIKLLRTTLRMRPDRILMGEVFRRRLSPVKTLNLFNGIRQISIRNRRTVAMERVNIMPEILKKRRVPSQLGKAFTHRRKH